MDAIVKAGKDAIKPIFRKTASHLEQYWKQKMVVSKIVIDIRCMLKPERRVVRVNRVLPKLRNTCVSVLSVCRTTLQETRGNGHEGYHATGAARR